MLSAEWFMFVFPKISFTMLSFQNQSAGGKRPRAESVCEGAVAIRLGIVVGSDVSFATSIQNKKLGA